MGRTTEGPNQCVPDRGVLSLHQRTPIVWADHSGSVPCVGESGLRQRPPSPSLPVSSLLNTFCLDLRGWEKMEGAELCVQYSELSKQTGPWELFSQPTLRTLREATDILVGTCDLHVAQILDEWRSPTRQGSANHGSQASSLPGFMLPVSC